MLNLIKWYYNLEKFSNNELSLLKTERSKDIIYNDEKFNSLTKEYFNRMPFCNINTNEYFLSFEDSATDFINQIFKKEVDDNTLVITTSFEHHSVTENLDNIKNKHIFKTINEIKSCNINELINKCKKYNKIFVYIIGTRLDTGEIIPQWFFEELKNGFIKNNIKHKIMIDDVHGMFLIPRDYSIFDYILYTAHAIVKDYDMGLLISKDKNIGIKAYNWGIDYLKRLDILLKRYDKILQFKNILIQYFNKLLSNEQLSLYDQTCDHMLSIKTNNLQFSKNDLQLLDDEYMIENGMKEKYNDGWLRIRFQEFIMLDKDKAIKGIQLLEKTIQKAIMIYSMRNGF